MPRPPLPPSGQTADETHEAGSVVTAEDAALAFLQLQLRIADLERENRFLRDSMPASAIAAPCSQAVADPPTSRPQPLN